jgi:hypothetical protein
MPFTAAGRMVELIMKWFEMSRMIGGRKRELEAVESEEVLS